MKLGGPIKLSDEAKQLFLCNRLGYDLAWQVNCIFQIVVLAAPIEIMQGKILMSSPWV